MSKSFEELYKEYLELKEAKEKAEEVVIRNQIRESNRKRLEASNMLVNECKEIENKLNRIVY